MYFINFFGGIGCISKCVLKFNVSFIEKRYICFFLYRLEKILIFVGFFNCYFLEVVELLMILCVILFCSFFIFIVVMGDLRNFRDGI